MKIFAVGMNYAQHNKELDGTLYNRKEPVILDRLLTLGYSQASLDVTRLPVIFTKADSALLTGGKPFFVPDFTEQCEYETEVVVRICRLGRSIAKRWAHRYYDQVTVGIDFTARDLHRRLRAEGLPWELCKGFDGSAVIGDMVKKEELPDIQDLHFRLDKNGETVQEGHTKDMLFRVDEIVSYISQFFTLKMGDLIYTGTPAGVGTVKEGDHIEGYLEGKKLLEFNVR